MKILAIMEFVSKSFFTILIFLLVKREEDLDLAVLATGVAHLIAGILSLILAFKSYRLNLTIPSLKLVRMQIYTGFPIFISQAMVPLYTSINVIILGAFTSNYIVGIYASAEKIFTALRGLNRPFNRSIFPYLSGLYNKDSSAYKSFVFKTERVYGVIFFFISLSCFIAAPFIMKLISGDLLEQNSILVFRILCLALLFVPYGPFYSQILVIEGKKKELIYVVFILVVINIIIAFIIIPLYFEIGLAIQVVIISFLVPVINLCFLKKGLFFR
jgi:PST family polysaccharide transporter